MPIPTPLPTLSVIPDLWSFSLSLKNKNWFIARLSPALSPRFSGILVCNGEKGADVLEKLRSHMCLEFNSGCRMWSWDRRAVLTFVLDTCGLGVASCDRCQASEDLGVHQHARGFLLVDFGGSHSLAFFVETLVLKGAAFLFFI